MCVHVINFSSECIIILKSSEVNFKNDKYALQAENQKFLNYMSMYVCAHLFRNVFDTHTHCNIHSHVKISSNNDELLLSAYYTPGSVLSVLHIYCNLILRIIL